MNHNANQSPTSVSANLPWLKLPRRRALPGVRGTAGWRGEGEDEGDEEDGSGAPSFVVPPTKPPRLSGGAALSLRDGRGSPCLKATSADHRAEALTH